MCGGGEAGGGGGGHSGGLSATGGAWGSSPHGNPGGVQGATFDAHGGASMGLSSGAPGLSGGGMGNSPHGNPTGAGLTDKGLGWGASSFVDVFGRNSLVSRAATAVGKGLVQGMLSMSPTPAGFIAGMAIENATSVFGGNDPASPDGGRGGIMYPTRIQPQGAPDPNNLHTRPRLAINSSAPAARQSTRVEQPGQTTSRGTNLRPGSRERGERPQDVQKGSESLAMSKGGRKVLRQRKDINIPTGGSGLNIPH